ncbi:ChbG/HpnK family deacetylase [Mucilaginibacter calamicampi]|uniref:ChbG/HpnK family deacetylase n=1 Tax=Mucilaginibacter calamicampi TaxID=1302352 RepID=A0ABW2YYA1_9SPHI
MDNIKNYTIIANADDFGLKGSVNSAIIQCFQKGYITSASIMTNSAIFDETVKLINSNACVINIGVHIDLVEFKPLTAFKPIKFLNEEGNWNSEAINKKFLILDAQAKDAFELEIYKQIETALSAGLNISHLDSHYHIHTLPCFYNLFIKAAKKYHLKLRLAQTYNEGNYLKFLYRKWLNNSIKKNGCNYSDLFEDVDHFLTSEGQNGALSVEIMLHPDLDVYGNLTDHYDPDTMTKWMAFLHNAKKTL